MEKILCAAILYHDGKQHPHQPRNVLVGYVWCGRRHHNIINLRYSLLKGFTREGNSTQGFLTTTDRFVDRVEAKIIAIKANQVTGNTEGDELFSEDLY